MRRSNQLACLVVRPFDDRSSGPLAQGRVGLTMRVEVRESRRVGFVSHRERKDNPTVSLPHQSLRLISSSGRRSASLGLAWRFALASALSLGAANAGLAQTTSLARYVPKDNLVLYFEFAGLDTEGAAWNGSAFAKVLNETKTGVMLEDLAAQAFDKVVKPMHPEVRLTGTEAVVLGKHALRSGFVFAVNGKPGGNEASGRMIVFRNAFGKASKPIFAKLLSQMNGPTVKSSLATKAGHKVVSVVDAKNGPMTDWWVDDVKKEDLILSYPNGTVAILETIDGTRPSAVDHPLRADLAKPPPGSRSSDRDSSMPPSSKVLPSRPASGSTACSGSISSGGSRGRRPSPVARIIAPKPRKGLLALFDQPTFAKGAMLTVPDGVEGFSVVSIDPGKVLDDLMAVAGSINPNAEAQLKKGISDVATKLKINIRDDVLGQIGPKFAMYNAPGRRRRRPAVSAGSTRSRRSPAAATSLGSRSSPKSRTRPRSRGRSTS